jgi:hypothetical protein
MAKQHTSNQAKTAAKIDAEEAKKLAGTVRNQGHVRSSFGEQAPYTDAPVPNTAMRI